MFRKVSKGISMVLILALTLGAAGPNLALAEQPVQTQDSSSNAANSTNADNSSNAEAPTPYRAKNQTRILELKDQRDQHSKYYLNSDGSTTVETAISSRHYQDNNGKWQDISNKLVPSNQTGFDLTNEANSFNTHFAKNSKANFLAKIKSDQTEIAWSLDSANQVWASNETYKITYPEIMPSTDLEYQPFADGLKENIILKDPNAPHTFVFQYQLKGLEPLSQPDGSIALQDVQTQEIKFVFAKPYMIDNQGQISEAVSYTLEPTNNPNRYQLTVAADSNWLNDPARSYPVTVDPTVSTVNWYTQVSTGEDTYIASNSAYSYYNSTYMSTGYDVGLHTTRSLVKFPLPTPPKWCHCNRQHLLAL